MNSSSPAFTSKYGKLARELQTPVKIKAHEDGTSFSEDQKFTAIWDTGATCSTITENVAVALGLKGKHVKQMTMTTPTSQKVVPCYYVDVLLPNQVEVKQVLVMEAAPCGCDVLIGMDIISCGDFAVSSYQGKTTFTFRCPSLMEFDFVSHTYNNTEVKTGQAPGRNSPCPCGSGKKFKQCHGKV